MRTPRHDDIAALQEHWDERLAAEGMPPEPKLKQARGRQAEFGPDHRPYLGTVEFPVDAIPGPSRTTVYLPHGQRPTGPWEALMVAEPHAPVQTSTDELYELWKPLSHAMEYLDAVQYHIIEACIGGGQPASVVAARLGISRAGVWKQKMIALAILQDLLEDHPTIVAYLARHQETEDQ